MLEVNGTVSRTYPMLDFNINDNKSSVSHTTKLV
jgi:hypothetical protein